MGRLYLAEATFIELFRVNEKMYLIHFVEGLAGVMENDYLNTFYVVDDETEAIEKLLKETEQTITKKQTDLKNCHATEELKPTLRRYAELLSTSPPLRSLAQQIIQQCPPSAAVIY